MGLVGKVELDELLASCSNEVPVVLHVHCLRVLEHNHILRDRLTSHCESWNGEVCGQASLREIRMTPDHLPNSTTMALSMVDGGDGQTSVSRVEVVKDAIAEAHPLIGDHLADLGGV